MITILRKSKKTDRQAKYEMSFNSAIEYVNNIESRDFRLNDFYVFSGSTYEEMQELKEYFVDEYFEEYDYGAYNVFKLNGNVNKKDRFISPGISIQSVFNFRDKIEEILSAQEVTVIFNKETFEIYIYTIIGDIKLVCDYYLNILESYGYNNGEFVNIGKSDTMVKVVNELFKKQRYYYKHKND